MERRVTKKKKPFAKILGLFGDYEKDQKYQSYLRQARAVGSCLDIRVTGVSGGKCEFGVFVSRGKRIKILLFALPQNVTDVATAS